MAHAQVMNRKQDQLLAELEGIHDIYRLDVKQFIQFVTSRGLFIVDGLAPYVRWLDEGGGGRKYSPATINRKIAAAKNRIRYAFRHSGYREDLRKRYQLEDVLGSVHMKKVDPFPVSPEKVLKVEQVRLLVQRTKDDTIRLMVTFLVGTGVRVSEMLAIRLSDITSRKGAFVDVRIIGKGSRERTVHIKKEILQRIKKHFHSSTHLFEHDGRPFNRISVTNRIKLEALRTIGREVTAQQLRHTWAATQIQRGKDIQAVAAVLGHSNPGMTAKMYPPSKLAPEEVFLDLEEAKPARPKTRALARGHAAGGGKE